MSNLTMSIILVMEVIPLSTILLLMTVDAGIRGADVSRWKVWAARACAALLTVVSTIGIVANVYWAVWGGHDG